VPSPFAAGLLFAFTAAFLYERDQVEDAGTRQRLDAQLLEQLVAPGRQAHPLDPRAVHQMERRLRGVGQPPRSTAEMAEWLRRLGDASAADLEGPMEGFLHELEREGRVQRIHLPRVAEAERWVLTEEMELYRDLVGLAPGNAEEKLRGGEKILYRYLETHALVSLQVLLGRYPFESSWA